MNQIAPIDLSIPGKQAFFGGTPIKLKLISGFHVFVGPNGSGKTETLRSLRDQLRNMGGGRIRGHVVYLSSGRGSALEQFRSSSSGPHHLNSSPAAVGQHGWRADWWRIEGAPGIVMRLKERPDLLLKVEARLQALYQRRLRLEWVQSGLQVGFIPTMGGETYYANAEASGLIQLIPLLGAIYDNEIGILIIDEPEISMHPQLQAFLLQEMETFAGDPAESKKKLIVIATHSPTMLPLRRIKDISQLVFFTDRKNAPIQIADEADELRNVKLSALIARLSENHKLAFFAKSVLLVEGPSDEIVVNGLSLRLEHPLLGNNTQVVPVTGKGQISETVKLFRLMGKNVFALADLDALSDDNKLINVFHESTQTHANDSGMESLAQIDHSIRNSLNTILDEAFLALLPASESHRYWSTREIAPDETLKAKRRATLAALLSASPKSIEHHLNGDLLALRKRFDALLGILDKAGCIILRCGTIEDYYFDEYSSINKPEAVAVEVERFAGRPVIDIQSRYSDVIRALQVAAPLKKIDENALLREQLGGLLGAAILIATPEMPDAELNARAAANFGTEALVFSFTNRSVQKESGSDRRVEVNITSPLFERSGFPFEFTERDNLTAVIEQKLPVV